jgi:hypothetical protein
MNPMEALIAQLMKGAGPRGAMFMGRHVGQMRPGEVPDTMELLSRPATDVPDAEGMGTAVLAAGVPLMSRMAVPRRQASDALNEFIRTLQDRAKVTTGTPVSRDDIMEGLLWNVGYAARPGRTPSKAFELLTAGLSDRALSKSMPQMTRSSQMAGGLDVLNKAGLLNKRFLEETSNADLRRGRQGLKLPLEGAKPIEVDQDLLDMIQDIANGLIRENY